ncbi:MAG: ACP S-malonyltransferase [Pseudomonadales bacterium]|jgi:[acyl-carrier-protein] S-malonyltransferase|nr:ACP S-malonyltransferase [Pseudomonadales bacterium]MCP5320492.1 ACP S-malonyltransferase [Pseudomonadales bacterium]MCP5336750.1 ACP S-malonyltransferase [Pseudomonadales bacterium]
MTGSLACVFPGQGSQRVGMLAAMAGVERLVRDTFAEASEVLGYDLWQLAQTGPQEELNLTERTQPLILTASVALWRVWCARGGLRPAFMAGHSLGEFSALVCAGSLAFTDAVRLVRNRGAYMQEAVPVGQGAMAAVLGLDDEPIAEACAEAAGAEVVAAVNFNAPGQVVIAGHAAAVERAIAACKARGAKRALPLPVSAPFHTSLMVPAGERLARDMAQVQILVPEIPVVHNVHARPEGDSATIRTLLERQIHSPVQWTASVRYMAQAGVTRAVEVGPGKVLGGLCKRIDAALECLYTEEPQELEKALASNGATE